METDNTTVRYKRSVKLVHNESIPGQWSLNTPIATIHLATVSFIEHPGERPTINTSTVPWLVTEIRLRERWMMLRRLKTYYWMMLKR